MGQASPQASRAGPALAGPFAWIACPMMLTNGGSVVTPLEPEPRATGVDTHAQNILADAIQLARGLGIHALPDNV